MEGLEKLFKACKCRGISSGGTLVTGASVCGIKELISSSKSEEMDSGIACRPVKVVRLRSIMGQYGCVLMGQLPIVFSSLGP